MCIDMFIEIRTRELISLAVQDGLAEFLGQYQDVTDTQ
jgi:hypothetical protein